MHKGNNEIQREKSFETKRVNLKKPSVGHKRETIFTVITMKSLRKIIVHECSKAHNDADVQPTYLLC